MNTGQGRAELLPCPFCGSTGIETQISTPDREGTPTHLVCADCGAAGPWSYERGGSYTGAAALWNTRAALQSQDKDGARLDWLQQHDGRFYNLLRITSIVNKGFSPTNNLGKRWFSSIREAIDHARRIEGKGND